MPIGNDPMIADSFRQLNGRMYGHLGEMFDTVHLSKRIIQKVMSVSQPDLYTEGRMRAMRILR